MRNSRLPIFSDLNAREQQAKSEDEDSKLSLTEIANWLMKSLKVDFLACERDPVGGQ